MEYYIVTIHFKNGEDYVGRFSKFAEHSNNELIWVSSPNQEYPNGLTSVNYEATRYITYRKEE